MFGVDASRVDSMLLSGSEESFTTAFPKATRIPVMHIRAKVYLEYI